MEGTQLQSNTLAEINLDILLTQHSKIKRISREDLAAVILGTDEIAKDDSIDRTKISYEWADYILGFNPEELFDEASANGIAAIVELQDSASNKLDRLAKYISTIVQQYSVKIEKYSSNSFDTIMNWFLSLPPHPSIKDYRDRAIILTVALHSDPDINELLSYRKNGRLDSMGRRIKHLYDETKRMERALIGAQLDLEAAQSESSGLRRSLSSAMEKAEKSSRNYAQLEQTALSMLGEMQTELDGMYDTIQNLTQDPNGLTSAINGRRKSYMDFYKGKRILLVSEDIHDDQLERFGSAVENMGASYSHIYVSNHGGLGRQLQNCDMVLAIIGFSGHSLIGAIKADAERHNLPFYIYPSRGISRFPVFLQQKAELNMK